MNFFFHVLQKIYIIIYIIHFYLTLFYLQLHLFTNHNFQKKKNQKKEKKPINNKQVYSRFSKSILNNFHMQQYPRMTAIATRL